MRAFVSLWSADLLDVGRAIDMLEEHVDGFHIDVMDGHYAPNLLFGPDFVRAVCRRTARPVEVHLMVSDADQWIDPFADAGCAWIAIHPDTANQFSETLRTIENCGSKSCMALTVDQPPEGFGAYLEVVDRVLMMGTVIGKKSLEMDPRTYERVTQAVSLRDRSRRRPDVVVDGGIRRQSTPHLAEAGADGVIPGSLVLGDPDPVSVLDWIKSLRPAVHVRPQ
jgi:ribulose-phosphate 3-epimerase